MEYVKKDLLKKMYFKVKLPKEQRQSIDKIFNKEEYIFDTQKIGDNAIINAVDKELIQDAIDCEGRIYYLYNNESIKIDYEISFEKKNIKVYLEEINNNDDRMIIQHYLDMFINALVEAHTGTFECEVVNMKKPEKLIIKSNEQNDNIEIKKETSVNINKVIEQELTNKSVNSLNEKAINLKETDLQNKQITKDGEDKMISLAKVYEEINSQIGDEIRLNMKVYFENNCFGVTIDNNTDLIADFLISEKEFYTRKEKINSLVSTFETVSFIENQLTHLVEKKVKFKKFFVMDQQIDENIGCPEGYIGYWNRNGNYVAM